MRHTLGGAAPALLLCLSTAACASLRGGSDAVPSAGGPLVPASAVAIPDDASLLWFPLTWTVRIEGAQAAGLGRAVDTLQLRNLGLSLRSARGKETTFVRMSALAEGDGGSRVALDTTRGRATFALPYFARLDEGEWIVEALSATYVDPANSRPSELRFPLDNPFRMPSGKPPLPLQARKGAIAALPRMAVQTTFGAKDGGLVSLTEVENVDRDALPVEFVLAAGKLDSSRASSVYAASPDFPRSRVSLLSDDGSPAAPEAPVARVGMLVEIPCRTKGVLKLVWRKVSDDREYFAPVPVEDAGQGCTEAHTLKIALALPRGEWILRSTHLVTSPLPEPPGFKLDALKRPDATLARYLLLGKKQELYSTLAQEKELKRQMVVRLGEPSGSRVLSGGADGVFSPQSPPRRDSLLFLGRFELVPVDGGKREEVWDTVFKRTFDVGAVREAFGAKDVFNAYTLRALEKGRAKGTVQGVLRVSSTQSDARALESSTAEFRKNSTEAVAACVTEREETDPLVTVEGTGTFHGLKGGDGVTIKRVAVTDEGTSAQWVRDCLQKKLLNFRFSRKLPASFQAEFKFLSE